jgi:hypothetical protein
MSGNQGNQGYHRADNTKSTRAHRSNNHNLPVNADDPFVIAYSDRFALLASLEALTAHTEALKAFPSLVA